MKLGEQRDGGRCGSCQEVSINGVRCHERGCPEAAALAREAAAEAARDDALDCDVHGHDIVDGECIVCGYLPNEPKPFPCCTGVGQHDAGCEHSR